MGLSPLVRTVDFGLKRLQVQTCLGINVLPTSLSLRMVNFCLVSSDRVKKRECINLLYTSVCLEPTAKQTNKKELAVGMTEEAS